MMNIKRLLFALIAALGFVLGVLWVLGDLLPMAYADPGTQHVAPGGNCGAASPCHATVQDAVDVASPGDVIKVAQGTYTDIGVRDGITQVVYISKTVTIQGGYTTSDWITPDPKAHPTTLDAQGQGRVVYITGDSTSTIEGLRITGGDVQQFGSHYSERIGGGIYIGRAAAVLSGNVIYSNTALIGGGVGLSRGSATLSGNEIYGNTAADGGGVSMEWGVATLRGNIVRDNDATQGSGWGGGLYLTASSDATLEDNVICHNEGWTGGGVTVSGCSATLVRNRICGNTSNEGGGVRLDYDGSTLRDNVIISNTALYGGGVSLRSSGATLQGNVVINNGAEWQGGGMFVDSSDVAMTNNVVADNRVDGVGGAFCIRASAPRLLHTTVARNSAAAGSGIFVTDAGGVYSAVAMTNTILFSHTVGITVTAGSTATLNGTLWHANGADYGGNVTHANDHSGDPAFGGDGYHLTAGSAAIDRGVSAGVETDIDGQSRDFLPDLGADECGRVYLSLVLR
jgi:hypothetical protein